ncbi:hypothetical protein AK830_g5945 [Neonectria ditissima]|uniref:Uncharacterized protein n=1 Tax=Neonectria ditissima TaxID=78410 RepID=A0A0P7AS90_9HYPO|nr:hypothetical protein AK830_g5945 [Neonectria ditissima]
MTQSSSSSPTTPSSTPKIPYLRLNVPLDGYEDGPRQNIVVQIHDLEKWRKELGARPQNRFVRASESSPPKTHPNSHRNGVVDGTYLLDWRQGTPPTPPLSEGPSLTASASTASSPSTSSVSSPTTATPSTPSNRRFAIAREPRKQSVPTTPSTPKTPQTSCWSDSSGEDGRTPMLSPSSLQPKFSGYPALSESRLNELNAEHEDILRHRRQTLEILEGTREPAPDRDYTGLYAPIFQEIARREAREKRDRLHTRRMLKSAFHSPEAPNLKGWIFLRQIIVNSLDQKNVAQIPPYVPMQQAFLMTVDKIRGNEKVRAAQNLDKLSNKTLLKLLELKDETRWRDVVWIGDFKHDINRNPDLTTAPMKLDWGQES